MIKTEFSGVPLDAWLEERRPGWRACVEVALRLVDALEAVHAEGQAQNDLSPARIRVSGDGGEVRLGALARAMLGGDEASGAEGTMDWAYMSPERAGRMNRRVDGRSDFYSLGILLYRMLTGTFPFPAGDPLEWAHSHAARPPRPPEESAPDLPRAVSDIVMKLLAKDPSDRYQTARGLRYDLDRCLSADGEAARGEALALGTRDVTDTLAFPDRLYGREKESEALLAAFRKVGDAGASRLALVTGYSGIGKSSLVLDFRRTVERRGGIFLRGKFDRLEREHPYAALTEAFRGLLQRILAGSEEEISWWRDRLGAALGNQGAVLVPFIPQLDLLLGPPKAAPSLTPLEARNRFHLLFRRFVGAAARSGEPLVIFLDDLQWADGGSLSLVEHLAGHPETRHLLIIGAYRANEVDGDHPLAAMLERMGGAAEEIRLGPPDEEALRRMLRDTLRCDGAAAAPLAALLRRKTGGNPFFVGQFLRKLRHDGLIRFDIARGAWAWDIASLSGAEVTDNVVELLAERFGSLDLRACEALRLAACLGAAFGLDDLARVAGRPARAIEADLRGALELDLIQAVDAPAGTADSPAGAAGSPGAAPGEYRRRYVWSHDRIQQAAYSLIPADDIPRLHLLIGRRLRGQAAPEALGDAVFAVAAHMNLGAPLIGDPAERDLAAALDLAAGLKAKAAHGWPTAIRFLSAGAGLLGPRAWDRDHALAFTLHHALAEACFLGGRPEEVIPRAEDLARRARTRAERAAALRLIHNAKLTRGEMAGAVEAELQCLALHGVELPDHPTWEEVSAARERVRELLAGRPVESLVDFPGAEDPDAAPMLITVPSFYRDKHRYILRVARLAAYQLEGGNTDASVLWYGSWGVVLAAFLDEYGEGLRFAKAAYALMEKRGALAYKGKACLQLGWTAVWSRPLAEVTPLYEQGFKAAHEAGDLIVACYCCSRLVISALASGMPLARFQEETAPRLAFVSQAGFRDIRDIIVLYRQFAKALQGGTEELSSLSDGHFDPDAFARTLGDRLSTLVCWHWILRMRLHYLAGEYARALEAGRKAEPLVWASAGQLPYKDWHLYMVLSLAATVEKVPEGELGARLGELDRLERQLRRWSEANPANFRHDFALAAAEVARAQGRDREAGRLYEESIRLARQGGWLPEEALACERAAGFHGERGYAAFADLYLRQARDAWRRWGADAKAAQLESLHAGLRLADPGSAAPLPEAPSFPPGAVRPGDRLDFLALTKASQALSSRIELDGLLTELMRLVLEGAGARKAQLLLLRDDRLHPAAEAALDAAGDPEVTLHPDRAADAGRLPLALVHYVHRTGETVVLPDAREPHPFSQDDYFGRARSKSVLCLPLLRMNGPVGLLYLENDLVPDAFTPDRLAATELLASQAAISLENARLFEERRRAGEALRESQQLLQGILDHTPAVIYVKDRDGRYLLVNRRYEEMSDLAREGILGRADYDLLPPETAKALRAQDLQVLEEGRAQEREETAHIRGEARTFLSLKFPLLDEAGRPHAVCGIATEITRMKEVEEQFRQSQKMEAVGRLAGGVAHDFNNMLTVINGYSLMAMETLAADHPLQRPLQGILGAGEKAAGLTHQLLAYSRKQARETRVLSLNTVVEEMAPMLKRLLGEDVRLETRLDPAASPARLDRGQLEQVLLNLAVNGRDAMPEGGSLLLETADAVLAGDEAGLRLPAPAGAYVVLTVSDTGLGMDPALRDRIFEPFFTTKEAGAGGGRSGTGLGLSVVYGIVKQSGGGIAVHSERGRGAAFRIYFPATTEAAEGPRDAGREAPESYRGSETLLLVEDDDSVRAFLKQALESQGYTVVETGRALEALRILGEGARDIRFVLTDVVMPELGGLGLAERLKELRPELPVLYMSGYTEDPRIHARLRESGGRFLQKPFSPFELARRVRAILDGKAA